MTKPVADTPDRILEDIFYELACGSFVGLDEERCQRMFGEYLDRANALGIGLGDEPEDMPTLKPFIASRFPEWQGGKVTRTYNAFYRNFHTNTVSAVARVTDFEVEHADGAGEQVKYWMYQVRAQARKELGTCNH